MRGRKEVEEKQRIRNRMKGRSYYPLQEEERPKRLAEEA